MAQSGNYDVVCFGHNHQREIGHANECLLINPGPIMGAKFSNGWEDVPASFVIYETSTKAVTTYTRDASGRFGYLV